MTNDQIDALGYKVSAETDSSIGAVRRFAGRVTEDVRARAVAVQSDLVAALEEIRYAHTEKAESMAVAAIAGASPFQEEQQMDCREIYAFSEKVREQAQALADELLNAGPAGTSESLVDALSAFGAASTHDAAAKLARMVALQSNVLRYETSGSGGSASVADPPPCEATPEDGFWARRVKAECVLAVRTYSQKAKYAGADSVEFLGVKYAAFGSSEKAEEFLHYLKVRESQRGIECLYDTPEAALANYERPPERGTT